MDYISVKEASELWGIDTSNIGKLCRKGKIEGAKLVGKSWLIPKYAQKPIDGRTKAAKEKVSETVFRFPLYVNFPVESYSPPLSNEETTLRQAQVFLYNCEFGKAQALFEGLAENADSIYVKICAHFYMCVLCAEYDMNISWDKYYCSMKLLLSEDFPYKKEIELFLPWLDAIIGQFGKIPEQLNTDTTYEYHSSSWYLNAYLSGFNYDKNHTDAANIKCTEPFGTLCLMMEHNGYFVEAQSLHLILFCYYFGANEEKAMQYHLRKAIQLAYEHHLLLNVADVKNYYAEVVNAVLLEYPDSFAERVQKYSVKIYDNFSKFVKEASGSIVYDRLSENDYRYVFYAIEGYPNKQVASLCGVSERTVAKKYNEIYNKLGIDSKQELISKMNITFGKK